MCVCYSYDDCYCRDDFHLITNLGSFNVMAQSYKYYVMDQDAVIIILFLLNNLEPNTSLY